MPVMAEQKVERRRNARGITILFSRGVPRRRPKRQDREMSQPRIVGTRTI
jgi:hypothetical protein